MTLPSGSGGAGAPPPNQRFNVFVKHNSSPSVACPVTKSPIPCCPPNVVNVVNTPHGTGSIETCTMCEWSSDGFIVHSETSTLLDPSGNMIFPLAPSAKARQIQLDHGVVLVKMHKYEGRTFNQLAQYMNSIGVPSLRGKTWTDDGMQNFYSKYLSCAVVDQS